jgi:hypothetical protein
VPKQIVSKALIATTPALAILKAFRIANKRAGEAKAALGQVPDIDAAPENAERERLTVLFSGYCDKLKELAVKAETLPETERYKLWVNFNGKTGHTYPKDYKVTNPNDNNFELHTHEVEQQQAAVSALLGDEIGGDGEGDDDPDDEHNDSLN